jgi:hypothetical protein
MVVGRGMCGNNLHRLMCTFRLDFWWKGLLQKSQKNVGALPHSYLKCLRRFGEYLYCFPQEGQ